jgi:hypothetical protein
MRFDLPVKHSALRQSSNSLPQPIIYSEDPIMSSIFLSRLLPNV